MSKATRSRLQPIERIAVAFDVETYDAAIQLRKTLGDSLGLAKVGSALFTREGMLLVKALKRTGIKIFLDLKFHDIPSVVEKAVERAAIQGVDYVTVHAAGGRAMIEAAVRGAAKAPPFEGQPDRRTRVLAVTVLTSLTLEDWRACSCPQENSIVDAVRRLGRMAMEAGADGLVCSAWETEILREVAGPKAILVTPGITTPDSTATDQARTLSVRDAVRSGSDILVIGRGICAAPDPRAALDAILQQLEDASG
jgi:orotidine-5'-phosphate decarboxylase